MQWVCGTVSQAKNVALKSSRTNPIILSYCCWRMLSETLHSTCPEFKVMASASAMSD